MKTIPIQGINKLSNLDTENKLMEIMERQISQLPLPPKGCYYTIDNPDFRFNYEHGVWEVNFTVVLKKAKADDPPRYYGDEDKADI